MPDIELKKIQPNRLNPRLEFNKAGLDELADSIRQVGLLEPIVVRPVGERYEVVVGERRYRASQQAGLDRVPVIIQDYADDEVMELNLIENIQREDLSAVEKGNLCKKLLEQFKAKFTSPYALSKRLGLPESHVYEWLQTTSLPSEVQRMIAPEPRKFSLKGERKVDYQSALAVTRHVKEPKKAIELIEEVAKRHVPQRMVTKIAKEVAREPEKPVKEVFREIVEEAPILLPFSWKHAHNIVNGIKTQTSRKAKNPGLKIGKMARGSVTGFADLQIIDIYRKRLGDFDEEDARREGGYTLDEFKEVWKSLHGEWNPDESVYVIRFDLTKVVGESSSSG